MTVLIHPTHRCALIAPTARAVRIVNREPPETAHWHVAVGDVPVCILELAIELGNRKHGAYRILAPNVTQADRDRGFPAPVFVGDGAFERSSPWWTKDVLRDVLRAIVRDCIAPTVVDITILYEGERKGG